jgi:DNA-binding IclR family transcriptional regulator
MQHDALIARIRAEYLEMPGLSLKAAQIQRLCGIEHATCEMVLQTLVDQHFLRLKSDGQYARLTVGPLQRPQMAMALLRPTISPLKAAS